MSFEPDYTELPENPLRKYRDEHRITQREMGAKSGVTVGVIAATESGQYTNIPTKILAVYPELRNVTQEYWNWRKQKRERLYLPPINEEIGEYVDNLILHRTNPELIHPFSLYIKLNGMNFSQACNWLCLNRGAMTQYITLQTKTLPRDAKDALLSAHLSIHQVDYLDTLGRIYGRTVMALRVEKNIHGQQLKYET